MSHFGDRMVFFLGYLPLIVVPLIVFQRFSRFNYRRGTEFVGRESSDETAHELDTFCRAEGYGDFPYVGLKVCTGGSRDLAEIVLQLAIEDGRGDGIEELFHQGAHEEQGIGIKAGSFAVGVAAGAPVDG